MNWTALYRLCTYKDEKKTINHLSTSTWNDSSKENHIKTLKVPANQEKLAHETAPPPPRW